MLPTDRPVNVLFLCTGNSARSILGESLLSGLGGERFRSFSAGSQPTGKVNPRALAALKTHGYPAEGFSSKNQDVFTGSDAEPLDIIFTVCDNAAGEICPIWPGHPVTVHWGIPDPAAASGSDAEIDAAFETALKTLESRIKVLVNEPLDGLDAPALKDRLRALAAA